MNAPANLTVEVTTPFAGEYESADLFRLHDDGSPLIHVADLGVTRGYGAFEVVHGVNRGLIAFDAHLDRLDQSCLKLLLPAIRRNAWVAASRYLLSQLPDANEFAVRCIVTAGGPFGYRAWLRYEPVPDSVAAERSKLRSAKGFDRGLAIGEAKTKPWLLHGVKSLSYGANLVTEKLAGRAGFDDAIYVSSDGYLLEGTTASVIALRDRTLITTPLDDGILPGTTQGLLYALANRHGLEVAYERISIDEVGYLDGLWLTSAVRLVTGVNRFDDTSVPTDLSLTARFNELVLEAAGQ